MDAAREIFVAVVGAGTDVWRPVEAEPVDAHGFRIIGQNPDPDGEVWEFTQGELVRCEQRTFGGESPGLVAIQKLELSGLRQPFLACYDYGQGGLWAWVVAESAAQIQRAYSELTVFARMPQWMTPAVLHELETCDLNAVPPTGLLAILTKYRRVAG